MKKSTILVILLLAIICFMVFIIMYIRRNNQIEKGKVILAEISKYDFKKRGLSAIFQNVVVGKDNITLNFVLNNTSSEPIFLYERWNSFGAYQWKIYLQDSMGFVYLFDNPEMCWTKNAPSLFEISPNSSHTTECNILLATTDIDQQKSVFTSSNSPCEINFPIKIIGSFTAIIDDITITMDLQKPNWIGKIRTAEIFVNAPK